MPEQNTAPEQVSNPKALFWFLTLFFSLDVMAVALGGLWFQFVNKWLNLGVSYGVVSSSFSQEAVKMEIASLIVATPVFFYMAWLVRRALRRGSLSPENRVRMWISYIILFLVVAISVGDLIRTLFAVLNGDFTVRFLLKALAILAIAAFIFVYYRLELKTEDALASSKLPKAMGLAAIVVIAVSLVSSFFVIESPRLTREKAFDRNRMDNLQSIKYAVDNYYYEYGKLPATLEELKVNQGYLEISDKENGKAYEYRVTGKEAFVLCADFSLASNEQTEIDGRYAPYNDYYHDAGHVCLDRVVSARPDEAKKPAVAP